MAFKLRSGNKPAFKQVGSKEETAEYKQNLIEVYMVQLLEGLYNFK